MSKQSDIFIQMEFKRKIYRNEINRAIKNGAEKVLNDEINKVNKVMRDRIKKLESKGMEKMSPAYRALGEALGTAGGKPVLLPPKAMSYDDKIQYLYGMRKVIDDKTMTLGGTRDMLSNARKKVPILEKIYQKHGEEYAASVYNELWELKSKTDFYRYQEVFEEHENQIIEILENFHDKQSVTEFNQQINELNQKVYNLTTDTFDTMISDYIK